MNTSENEKCRRCGTMIPAKTTGKLCPACLMSGALEQNGDRETVLNAPGDSSILNEPVEFPCEFGDYQLLGLLGRGGMGTVYEAVQLTTGRRVALKMLGRQLDSPEMRQRFLREGRLAAGVNHPNSLYIFGSEEIEGLPVITMEIAGSGTLQDKLKKRGPLPVAEAVDDILSVISGLEAAFMTGILRGLLDKPAEVGKGIRAGSIFMLPLYVWVMILVGSYTADSRPALYENAEWIFMAPTLLVLAGIALVQLLLLPLRSSVSLSLFRLAIVDDKGNRAGLRKLFLRWGIAWLPLLAAISFVALLIARSYLGVALIAALALTILWISAGVCAAVHPSRGIHDRLAGTWIVRL